MKGTKMAKGFNTLAFIASAIATDPTRYFMCDAYFDKENSRLVATDGLRLHFWDMSEGEIHAYNLQDVPESTYVKILVKDNKILPFKLEAQYPNYKRVIPEYDKQPENKCILLDGKHAKDMEITRFCARTGIAINYKYMADIAGKNWQYEVASFEPEKKAVKFFDPKSRLTAIIMPFRIEED